MKGLGNETERVNEITGDFATLLSGSVDTALQTTQGQTKQLKQELANLEEELGRKLLPLQKALNKLKLGVVSAISDALSTPTDKLNQAIEERADRFYNVLKVKGEKLGEEELSKAIDVRQREVEFIEKIIDGNQKIISQHRSVKETRLAEERIAKAEIELIERKGKLLALQRFNANISTSTKSINPNAGQDEIDKPINVIKPIVVKPTKIEIDVKDADVLFKDGDATVPNLKSDAIKVAPVTKIENTPEFQNAESEREVIRQKIKDQEKADAEEKARQERIDLYNNTLDLARAAQDQLRIEEDKTNRLIALQEKRVESVRNQSSASLKIEQDRLNELLKKRQQYERAQRVIDAAVITANTAVAISGAIATIAKGGNAITIAANVLSILAGIGAVVASIRSINTDPGFKEGGYTGDGDPSSESTAIGKRPYKYHKKEFVMNEELTRKHRDLFDGLHNKDLVVNKLDDGKWYITQNGLDNNAMVNDHYSVKNDSSMMPLLLEMQGIRSLLKQREVKVENNFDADGFGMAVATQMGGITLKNKRRQW
jgi:hypothetical protein